MKTSIQEIAFTAAIVAVVFIAFCVGVRKEIHRQDAVIAADQRNGYCVECR